MDPWAPSLAPHVPRRPPVFSASEKGSSSPPPTPSSLESTRAGLLTVFEACSLRDTPSCSWFLQEDSPQDWRRISRPWAKGDDRSAGCLKTEGNVIGDCDPHQRRANTLQSRCSKPAVGRELDNVGAVTSTSPLTRVKQQCKLAHSPARPSHEHVQPPSNSTTSDSKTCLHHPRT